MSDHPVVLASCLNAGKLKRMMRPATPSDLERVYRFDHLAHSDESRREFLQAATDRGECWVVESGGVPIAYGVMNYSFFGRGFVSLIFLHPAHRRKGVAGQLFDEFEARCASKRIFTSTNLSNAPMRSFLSGRGYVPSGVLHYLDEDDPKLFFSKPIG